VDGCSVLEDKEFDAIFDTGITLGITQVGDPIASSSSMLLARHWHPVPSWYPSTVMVSTSVRGLMVGGKEIEILPDAI
jgi:hypothetical protein